MCATCLSCLCFFRVVLLLIACLCIVYHVTLRCLCFFSDSCRVSSCCVSSSSLFPLFSTLVYWTGVVLPSNVSLFLLFSPLSICTAFCCVPISQKMALVTVRILFVFFLIFLRPVVSFSSSLCLFDGPSIWDALLSRLVGYAFPGITLFMRPIIRGQISFSFLLSFLTQRSSFSLSCVERSNGHAF